MIRVRDLGKTYGARPALRGVSFDVEEGQRVALVGPNGSGKTTLLRCLLGLVSYTGQITVSGHDPLRDHAAAQVHVAYVPQRAPALPVPVNELVRFWAGQRKGDPEALIACCATFGLDLSAVWRQRFPALSGGMQQKLLAAMAIASECPVMLLDEPTANLDPRARSEFFEHLARRTPAPTLLLSSHRLDEVRHLVDRVIVLTDGEIAFDDRLDRFLADSSLAEAAGIDAPSVLAFRRLP